VRNIMNIIDKIKPYAKAVVGFITPGVVALGVAVQESSPGGQAVTVAEWIGIALACLGTGAVVYGVPNRPAYRSADPDEPDA
jgi:hypothetical protein